jgi:Thioesterase-like superfamily
VIGCHYRRLGADGDYQLFDPTDATRSNSDRTIQHGSPPLALMTKLIEELATDSGLRIGRICLDMLGPMPVTRMRARARIDRPGRRISMFAAQMVADRPDRTRRVVARASAWLPATSDTRDVAFDRYPPLAEGEQVPLPRGWADAGGVIDALSWRRQKTEADEHRDL